MRIHGFILTGAMSVALAFTSSSFAKMISANYCSTANIYTTPAGYVPAYTWNNLTDISGQTPRFYAIDSATGPGGSQQSSGKDILKYEDGSNVPAATTIAWTSGSQNANDARFGFDGVTFTNYIDDGNDQLMAGYLEAANTQNPAVVTVTVTGLNLADFGGSATLILYLDGDGSVENPTNSGQMAISIASTSLNATVYGEDLHDVNYIQQNDGTNPLSWYTPITSTTSGSPTAGNMVIFTGITSSDFTITISGTGGHGAALNGFQIVPEPATIALIAIGGLLMAHRRKHHA